MKLPQRTAEHVLEESSVRFFQRCLPKTWTTSKPANDYGTDLIVNIFEGHETSPYEIHVQLKSSQASTAGDLEKAVIRIATYNYLLKQVLHIAMLVKYVAEENEAYYIFLRDIPEPNQDNETFIVNIPKQNRLSTIDWNQAQAEIKEVIDLKLSAGEALRYYRQKRADD